MRLRNKSWTNDFIKENSEFFITGKGKIIPKKIFQNKNKTYLEIGCGKGKFSIEQSIKNPNHNFIAMEKETTVIGVAAKKAIKEYNLEPQGNLVFCNDYAEKITKFFKRKSLDGIFLNFSDPWPKSRHAKKRLTYVKFLNDYYKVLKKGGTIEIKTDNDNLYLFTLDQLKESKFKLLYKTNDLYKHKKQLEDNVATEYETKFHESGKNINKIIVEK